jgi:hypothetical protein
MFFELKNPTASSGPGQEFGAGIFKNTPAHLVPHNVF